MGRIYVKRSDTGNNFIVAYNRMLPNDSFSQRLLLHKEVYYTFSAWVQITEGDDVVVAALKYPSNSRKVIGSVVPQIGCWSMIKGGIVLDNDTQAQLYFEIRKGTLRLHVSNKDGSSVQNAHISLEQTKPSFPLGCGITVAILDNKNYQNWFSPRFNAMTFDNEMKWDFTERTQGHENYTISDAMFDFAEKQGISVRGHTILWDNKKHIPKWVEPLSPRDLVRASVSRVGSVMSRYSGRVTGWDVMNENLHFSFFEEKIGPNATAMFFKIAQTLDPETQMFLNEYNTLEYSADLKAIPSKYARKIKEIRSFPGNEEMVVGIGVQAHFHKPNVPYMRACLDILAATKMPIWLTELTVNQKLPNQAKYLEEIMREAYSHPGVEGIIVWAGWKPSGCTEMCLTDNIFKNLPAGDVVDKLIDEWKTKNLEGFTDENGVFQHKIFKGQYILTFGNPDTGEISETVLDITNENTDVFIQI